MENTINYKNKEYSTEFLTQNHLVITFLKQKMFKKKLALCIGAGFSFPFGLPSWKDLVKSISEHEQVNGKTVYENNVLSLTTKIQVLFETYRKNYLDSKRDNESEFIEDEIRRNWIKIVQECLYKKYHDLDESDRSKKDIYFDEFIEIIKESPVTVNYNFDDVIERELQNKREDQEERNYETTSRPFMQFKREKCVIYHPNGFIPKSDRNGVEGNFVFSEKSFQDQLIDTMSGRYSPLQYLFLNYTMLLTGISLDDPTLRHILRKNATLNPGHFHVFIYYDKEKGLSEKDKLAIQESYFETFNLITLFFNGEDIKQLAQYIALSEKDYNILINKTRLFRSFKFYLSGSPGTGKTTSLDYLADFVIKDEFLAPTKEELLQQDTNLKDKERVETDVWVTEQFRLRNSIIFDEDKNCCIQLIDRSPIDPLGFVDDKKEDALLKRAKELKDNYYSRGASMVNGKIIVLEAKANTIFTRLNKRNPREKPEDYAYQMDYINKTIKNFNSIFPSRSYKHIDSESSKAKLAKDIAHEIFFGRYTETDFKTILSDIIQREGRKQGLSPVQIVNLLDEAQSYSNVISDLTK